MRAAYSIERGRTVYAHPLRKWTETGELAFAHLNGTLPFGGEVSNVASVLCVAHLPYMCNLGISKRERR